MKKNTSHTQTSQRGFVIFVALFMVILVTTIGIFIVNITIKEFRLANIQQGSLRALYAADILLECAFHHDVRAFQSPFPSYTTASLGTLPNPGESKSTSNIGRRGSGSFPGNINCAEDETPSLETRYDVDGANHIVTTSVGPMPLYGGNFKVCSRLDVEKVYNSTSGEETTRYESRGINTNDCNNPGSRVVERAFTLIWGDRN